MLEHVGAAKQSCPDPAVMVEQRVDFSRWVRQGFGTADALIIADGTLHIIDLKYGSGIWRLMRFQIARKDLPWTQDLS